MKRIFGEKNFIKKSAKNYYLHNIINNPPPQRHTNAIENIKKYNEVLKKITGIVHRTRQLMLESIL